MSIRKLMVNGYSRLAFLVSFFTGVFGFLGFLVLYLTHKPLSL